MAGNRRTKTAPRPLWHITSTHLARVLPDAHLDLFSFPTLSRLPSPKLPRLSARPSALTLSLPSSSTLHTLIGSQGGDLCLDTSIITTIPGGVGAVAASSSCFLAAGGTRHELLVVSPAGKVLKRHSLLHHLAPISALAVDSAARRALVCSQAITMVDVNTGNLLQRFAGHVGFVTVAVSISDGRFVTGGTDDFICVWDGEGRTGGEGKRRKKMALAPSCVLGGCEGGVRHIGVDTEGKGEVVTALLRDGQVGLWDSVGRESSVPCRAIVKGSSGEDVFGTVVRGMAVSVVHGNPMKPSLWRIDAGELDSGELVLPEVDANVLASKGKDVCRRKAELVKGVAALEGSAVPALPHKDKRKENGYVIEVPPGEMSEEQGEAEKLESAGGEDDDGDADDGDEDDEPSIQQKLLELGVTPHSSGSKPPYVGLPEFSAGEKTVLGSRVSVLMQAVQAQDSDLFDQTIIKLQSRPLIRGTVERLPSSMATGALLDMLVERLRQFPGRAEVLILWIREIMYEHTGALISKRKNDALIALMSIVRERTQALEGLARLEGRLALVVNQVERQKRCGEKELLGNAVPVAEYEEEAGSSEEEDSSGEESSGESQSEEDDAEDETGAFSGSDESSDEEESDEEMEDLSGANGVEYEKGGRIGNADAKMNGRGLRDEDGQESESSIERE